MSHILDYTKVNNFSQGPLSDAGESTDGNDFPLSIYSIVNIAALCEDAVHIVTEGHTYDQSSKAQGAVVQNTSIQICPSDNYFFKCTPGAIQRVVMNLLGNSLKFTKQGFIDCQVETHQGDNCEVDGFILRIIVTDTGIGISDDFLRHRLYSAFTQESSFSSGTGLGLSIVKKTVQSLNGSVSIQSQIDKGTQVTVEIPLTQSIKGMAEAPDTVAQLQAACREKTVLLSGFESSVKSSLRKSLHLYITEWFHMTITEDLHLADFVIIDEKASDEMITAFSKRATPPRVVIASSAATRDLVTHWVAKPVGPYCLAKTMLACWREGELNGLAESRRSADSSVDSKGSAPSVAIEDSSHCTSQGSDIQRSYTLLSASSGQDVGDLFNTKHGHTLHVPATEMSSSCSQPLHQPSFTVLSQEESEDSGQPRVKQPSILCVDDNAINLKLIQAYLKKLEYTDIKCVADGLEAAKAFESSETGFDLIFMGRHSPSIPR